MQKSLISLRVSTFIWLDDRLCDQLLEWLAAYRDTIAEVAFFTGFTHPPLPLATLRQRAARLGAIIPRFQALGLRSGINHLATIGHLDENPENSLHEPWQHLVDISGAVSKSCYCAADSDVRAYIRDTYVLLAQAKPDFIWVDDDVRLESHPQNISLACFCDRCLADFAAQTGKAWQREELRVAFNATGRAERLALRRQWLQHNRDYIARVLSDVRAAVDTVSPALPLGFMTGEISYSGYGFDAWAAALAGPHGVEVKWRPGGGFYTDDRPLDLLGKVNSVGRQTALLPQAVTEVQWEHENFPYQVLKKSRAAFVAEIAGAIGAGCTGCALNVMGIAADPFDEYRPYFDAVRAGRRFFGKAVGAFGRSTCEGVWPAFTQDHVAALHADGDWATAAIWGGSLGGFGELTEIGLPTAYSRAGAKIAILSGAGVLEWTRDELADLLSGAVLLDGPALLHLQELGLAELAGFTVCSKKEKDTTEVFSADPLNGRFAGWHRDCRPSFWPQTTYLLKPLAPAAGPEPAPAPGADSDGGAALAGASRVLATVQDFTPTDFGPCAGVFENQRGGRVAVLGYYPWNALQSLAKVSQMRSLCRWLCRGALPAYVASFHRAAVWCRRDADGQPALMVLNASLDPAESLTLHVLGTWTDAKATLMNGRSRTLTAAGRDGGYAVFNLPRLGAWEAALVTMP